MNFHTKLQAIVKKQNSLVAVGLDPELEKIPAVLAAQEEAFYMFNKAIIDATHDVVAAYKPNIAFYEACGIEALRQLKKTIEYLKSAYPHIPIVLDAKRGDIGNTAKMYARAVYDYWEADAVTVYPHLGLDSLEPFFHYKDKLTIVLIKTSNPDSGMFQNLKVGGEPYYLSLAKKIKSWEKSNLGIFVGATYPKEMTQLRTLFPQSIFLSAGIGAQQGEIGAIVKAGIDNHGEGIMFNASRSIIYASRGEDFAEAARAATTHLRDEINNYRSQIWKDPDDQKDSADLS